MEGRGWIGAEKVKNTIENVTIISNKKITTFRKLFSSLRKTIFFH